MAPGSSVRIKPHIMRIRSDLFHIHMLHIYIEITPVYSCHNSLYGSYGTLKLHSHAAVPFISCKTGQPIGLRKPLYEPAKAYSLYPAIGPNFISFEVTIHSFSTILISIH